MKKKIIIIVCALLVIAAGVGVYFYLNKPNNNDVFKKSIANLFAYETGTEKLENKYYEGKLYLDTTNSELSEINDYVVNYDIANQDDSLMVLLDVLYQNKSDLNVQFDFQKEIGYITLKNIFDKVISVGKLTNNESLNFTADDLKYFGDKFSQIIDMSVIGVTKESGKLTYDNKENSVDVYTLKIDGTFLNNFVNNFKKEFGSDNKSLEIFSRLMQVTTDEVKVAINSISLTADDLKSFDDAKLLLKVYNNGAKTIGINLSMMDGTGDATLIATDTDESFIVLVNGQEALGIKKVSDNKYSFNVMGETGSIVTAESSNASKTVISFDRLDLSIISEVKESTKKISEINQNNAILIDDLTEADQEKIMTELAKSKTYNLLMKLFQEDSDEQVNDDGYYDDDISACDLATCDGICINGQNTCLYQSLETGAISEIICPCN